MGHHHNDMSYRATIAKLPKCDWYHVKFMFRVFASEAFGLGMIVFIVACHGAGGELKSPVSGPVTASAAFAVAVWTMGPISGPQLTAALSLALILTRRMNFVYGIIGVFGQLCGSLLGIGLAACLIPGLRDRNNFALHAPGPGVTDGQAFGLECICTFLLIACCLSTLDESRNAHWAQGHVTQFSVVVFLLILMLAAIMAKITGCGMNPAASMAAAIYNTNYTKLWIYIVAPVVGTVIAVLFWEMVLSDAASIDRAKHWLIDPHFDRTKDYKRLNQQGNVMHESEEAMAFSPKRSHP